MAKCSKTSVFSAIRTLAVGALLLVSANFAVSQNLPTANSDSLIRVFHETPDDAERIRLLSLICRTHPNADTTLKYGSLELDIAKASGDSHFLIEAYKSLAWCHYRRYEMNQAAQMYRNALEICDMIGDMHGSASCYHNLASVMASLNKYVTANEYEHIALDIFYSLNDEESVSSVCKSLGQMCTDHHLYKTATDYLNQALEIDTRLNEGKPIPSNDIGTDYLYLGDVSASKFIITRDDSLLREAKSKLHKAHKIFTDNKNYRMLGRCCENLMSLYLESALLLKGKERQAAMDSSQIYYSQGYELTLASRAAIQLHHFDLWRAVYALEKKQYDKTYKLLKECEVAIKSDSMDLLLPKLERAYSHYYEAIGQYKEAYEHWVKATNYSKNQINREFAVKVANTSVRNDFDKMILQREDIERQEKTQRHGQEIRLMVITIASIVAFILIIVLIFATKSSIKKTQKQGQELKERNEELESQKDQLECINDQIASGINYAQMIQKTMLPAENKLNENLGESLILWQPLDLVSGDFYWTEQINGLTYVAAVDCTGHGVPGAFMSMLGATTLADIVLMRKNFGLTAGKILDIMRERVTKSLRQSEQNSMSLDGMDMALCIIDRENMTMQYAGAFRPLLIVRNGEMTEYKADKMSISYLNDDPAPFKNHIINLEKGDIIYMFSDGLTDQLGYNEAGEESKFSSRRLQKLLLENHARPFDEQKKLILERLGSWRAPAGKKPIPQTDDMILVGFRI